MESISEKIKKNNIKWVQIHFVDLMGRLRVLHLPSSKFFSEDIFKSGINFDGSSVGISSIEKSDMILIPDKETFSILPHENDEAKIMADIYDANLNPSPFDSRRILKSAVKELKDYEVKISPEIEFYVIREVHDMPKKGGYFAPPPFDEMKNFRKCLSEILAQSGYNIKYHHHETGSNQHEIEIGEMDAISSADFCIYFKYIAREIAKRHGIKITFMPKPFSDDAGSGMHIHISLYKNGKNVFYDRNDEYGLSKIARFFIGGVLSHARGISLLSNPTSNSYKRLVPNFEAPVYVAWARHNRSSLIRIPAKKEVDIEIRNGDPSANPYLFFSAVIYAGIDGIRNKIEFEPVEENIYEMDEEEIKRRKIKKLPSTLIEAVEEFEKDEVIRNAIGEASKTIVERKRMEWNEYMLEVTPVDYRLYMDC
ncbi:MAG: glutamine synthetase [Thermoplasmatales archaeon]|nr:glutamine synthetase [Thermoplasmatales archaeon]